jgi:hypothetical protein
MIIPIPIPIFIRQKSNEELQIEQELSTHDYYTNMRIRLNKDIEAFKQRFKNDLPIEKSPEKRALFRMFKNKNIDDLNLIELMALGLPGDNVSKLDCDQAEMHIKVQKEIRQYEKRVKQYEKKNATKKRRGY